MNKAGFDVKRQQQRSKRGGHRPIVRRLISGATVLAGAAVITVAVADESSDDAVWSTYNHDAAGTRFNQTENILSASNVGGLKVKWQIPTPAPVTGTPVVSDGVVYAGDMAGIFYALKTDGTLLWSKSIDPSGITASAAVVG